MTGASGQLGRELARSVPAGVGLQARSRSELDITRSDAVEAAVSVFRPDLIVNAAAYTAVDRAEAEPEKAAAVNVRGAQILAEAARGIPGCRLIQISTDHVFDGQADRPYGTRDEPNPLSVYGRTKWEGECAVRRVLSGRALILRTAWLYGAEGRNFVRSVLKLMREQGAVRVVNDQTGTPTSVMSVANAVWRLMERPEQSGVAHWTDEGPVTRFDFACGIAEEARAAGLLAANVKVLPIATAEYPTPARRPPHCILDIRETASSLGLTPIPWREPLRQIMARLARAHPEH